jgi:HAMP domain-containing protein
MSWSGNHPDRPAPPFASRLGLMLQNERDLADADILLIRDSLGWTFDPEVAQELPGHPIQVLFQDTWSWFLWHRDPLQGKVRFAIIRTRDLFGILSHLCQTATWTAPLTWAVIHAPTDAFHGSPDAREFLLARPSDLAAGHQARSWAVVRCRAGDDIELVLARKILVSTALISPGSWAPGFLVLAIVGLIVLMKFLPHWSFRSRLGFLIFYLASVPLLMSGMVTSAYHRHCRLAAEAALRFAAEDALQAFDASYAQYLRDLEGKLRSLKHLPAFRRSDFAGIEQVARDLFAQGVTGRFIALDEAANDRLSLVASKLGWSIHESTRLFLQENLRIRLGLPQPQDLSFVQRSLLDFLRATIWAVIMDAPGRLRRMVSGNRESYTFIDILDRPGPPRDRLKMFFIGTSQQRVANTFLRKTLPGNHPFRILVRRRENDQWFPAEPVPNDDVQSFATTLALGGESRLTTLVASEPAQLALGCSGVFLGGMDLIALIPAQNLDLTGIAWLRLFQGTTLAALLLVFAAWYLLSQSILRPLGDLLEGIGHLRRQNLAYRIPVHGLDELGRLAQGFNHMIEVSGELGVAMDVQARLRPASHPNIPGYSFSFWEQSTLTLGGSYYDWIPLSDGTWMILSGRVSGQGIGSALVAGMSKALVRGFLADGRPMTTLTNYLSHHLADVGLGRHRLALALLHFDPATHRGQLVLAGAPQPVLYRHGQRSTALVGTPSRPLGGRLEKPPLETSVIFEPGDVLVLYSLRTIQNLMPSGAEIGYATWQFWVAAAGASAGGGVGRALCVSVQTALADDPVEGSAFLTLQRVSDESAEQGEVSP